MVGLYFRRSANLAQVLLYESPVADGVTNHRLRFLFRIEALPLSNRQIVRYTPNVTSLIFTAGGQPVRQAGAKPLISLVVLAIGVVVIPDVVPGAVFALSQVTVTHFGMGIEMLERQGSLTFKTALHQKGIPSLASLILFSAGLALSWSSITIESATMSVW